MQSIIDGVIEKLKSEFAVFFSGKPSIDAVEEFSWEKLKRVAAELTEAYAEETDQALYEDRAGRKAVGMSVERRGNRRTILTDIGEISYERTYYALKDGTYDYPVDRVLGIGAYQRISNRTILKLTGEAKESSYASASRIITEGKVSRQTVMNAVRRCQAGEKKDLKQRHVPVLHVDADEDHVSLQNGRAMIIPLVTVYEGVGKVGEGQRPRRKCINVFHHSALTAGEEFWNDVYERIVSRYDLSGTKIYLHGDGAAWIKQGLEHLPNSKFVLDCYHKNKAKKMLFAGCGIGEAKTEKTVVINAFRYGNGDLLIEAGRKLMEKHPERQDRIQEGLNYLYQNLDAITIRYQDPEARNGGATEPHVSHVLSRRLSSRPMGWSTKTLEHLVPILAAGTFELITRDREKDQSDYLDEVVKRTPEGISMKRKASRFAVDPDRCVSIEVIRGGQVTQLYKAMKGLSR